MTEAQGRVEGSHDEHQVTFYGLSTCVWCRRTRKYLEDREVAFDYTYVDLLEGEEQDAAKEQVRRWNPRLSFPTVVIDAEKAVVGYHPEEIGEALGL